MSTAIIVMPKYHLLKVMLTTPQAASLVAGAMEEVTDLKKPWYGFKPTPGTKPSINGCCVSIGVQNPKGDTEGLECNKNTLSLRAYRVFTPDQIRGNRLAPVLAMPVAS